jgi:hypothetical protein
MPALDACHPHVVNALVKDGWTVAPKPYTLKVERGHVLFIDIQAEREEDSGERVILLVEVKCFPEGSAATSELYVALGQYMVYQSLLKRQQIDAALYLAVPVNAYDDVISRLALEAIDVNQVRIVIVDMDREVITQWLT